MGRQHQRVDWPRLSHREQLKEGDEEADIGKDGKATGQDYPPGNSSRRETKRQTEETTGRQHQRVD